MHRTGTQTDFDNVDTDPTSPTFNLHTEETVNAPGKSKIKGFEADLTVQPVWNLQLSASYAYTDINVPATPNPFLPGNPLFQVHTVYTPKHAASGAIDYELPVNIAEGKLKLHLDANYASKQYSFQAESIQTDSSFIVNGRLALADIVLNDTGSLMTLALWSRNLLNETHIYRISGANEGVLGDYANFNPPRTFGVEASFNLAGRRRAPAPAAAELPPPPPPPPATQTCADGSVILATEACPAPPPPPPPPPPAPERG
jgi:iron complex outermembrane receptor protein